MGDGEDYTGDVSCVECWEALRKQENAQMIDVRNMAEWAYVGVPVLTSLSKEPILAEWLTYPDGKLNTEFSNFVSEGLRQRGCDQSSPLFLLCRSGVRSKYAAAMLVRSGYQAAYNVVGGFEGDCDIHLHRGNTTGWKFDNLPWAQK